MQTSVPKAFANSSTLDVAIKLVLDASVGLAWFRPDEDASSEIEIALDAVTESGALVPGNFFSEISNALIRAERRGLLNETAATAVLGSILALDLRAESADPHLTMSIARRYRLTCYDASYLALAVERQCLVITVDDSLSEAADALDVLWRARPQS